ncbi:MAG: hypothetical protein LUM44_24035 [Pyrinomonadaceae bacterium]|nr:hypothetical protein [Pyrinomonadaceae bacterium]
MSFLLLLLQIGDLFNGKFNWRGVIQLAIFIVMGLIVVGVGGVIVYKAFSSKGKDKNGA